MGFTDIPRTFGARFRTVPVLEDGGTMLAESWDIAEHLGRAFPRAPVILRSRESVDRAARRTLAVD